MKTLRCVKGMHDILPTEMPKWHFVEKTYRRLVEQYGYGEIRTPILEPLELFVRGIGETTDIVEKEMYSFEDKGGARLGLRPEGTASAIRAYNQHGIQAQGSQTKWYYIGPMFRRERPAKGRYRQFYQAGAELIGSPQPGADAEIIEMAVRFIDGLGIGDVSVQINTLGDETTRSLFRLALVDYFSGHREQLCNDCRRRLEVNPLRIVDCKVEGCSSLAEDAPSVLSFLSDEAGDHFEELKRILDRAKIEYKVVPTMVRGLDYYTSTIFEVQVESDILGAQTAIVGGGRYDTLIKQLGGKLTPAIGFSFGLERLIMVLGKDTSEANEPLVFVAGVGKGGLDRSTDIARKLRDDGYRVEISFTESSLRSQLKRANRLQSDITIIAGEDEAQREAVTVRKMEDGHQEEVQLSVLSSYIEANQ
jgi:histidyl-tRNA synthetase